MTITLKDLKHLEVMSSLENTAPSKAPEINIKDLITEVADREPTLNEKIVSLCTKLRTDGFEKQADALETKFLAYKVAGTHLYNTHDEDGEDLIEFAHPDGEVKVEDASKDLGHVETILTEHKKLVDIVNKSPTGKLASQYADALKYITAQDVNELDTVNLQDISKKFQYMADYLQKHFTNTIEGSMLPPHARDFYGTVGVWQDLARTIATELNHAQVLPITQAMQLVKNRLQNSQSHNVQQYVTKVNHVSDIDKLVSWILGWAEDNNPMKKSASVKVAQTPDMLVFYSLYKMYKSAKQFWGDLKDKSEELIPKLESLREDSDAAKFPELIKKINNVVGSCNKIIAQYEKLSLIQGSPQGKALQLAKAKSFFSQFADALADLHTTINGVYKAVENGIGSKIYHLFAGSNFAEARTMTKSMLSTVNSFVVTLENLKEEASKSPGTGAAEKDLSLDFGAETASADVGIAQLKDWAEKLPTKNNIPAEKKQEGLNWINQQMKEFEDNKSNPDKINALMKENKAFADEWMK